MKKMLTFCAAAVAMLGISGCRWCTDNLPGDASCIELSHQIKQINEPAAASFVSPNMAVGRQVFRPVFRVGAGRLTVTGVGDTYESATNDAIRQFLAKANCDYIVAVSKVADKKSHPTWRLWGSSSYSVTISGIPMYLDNLEADKLTAEDLKAYDDVQGVFLPARGDNDPVHTKLVR